MGKDSNLNFFIIIARVQRFHKKTLQKARKIGLFSFKNFSVKWIPFDTFR